MKKLLIFCLGVIFLGACNNNGGIGMGGGSWSNKDRSDFMDPCVQGGQTKEICSCVLQKLEKKYSNLTEANTKGGEKAGRELAMECMNGGGNNNGNGGILGNMNGNNNGGGGWTTKEQNSFLNPCVNGGQTKEICSCVLEKLQKKYPSFKEADTKGTAAEGRQLALECINGGGNNNPNIDNGNINNNDGGNWTREEHQQYVQGCANAAQQSQGFTAEQANEYCDCMTTKVEQKHTFREASQMTAADFQTEEWQNAAAGCRPRN